MRSCARAPDVLRGLDRARRGVAARGLDAVERAAADEGPVLGPERHADRIARDVREPRVVDLRLRVEVDRDSVRPAFARLAETPHHAVRDDAVLRLDADEAGPRTVRRVRAARECEALEAEPPRDADAFGLSVAVDHHVRGISRRAAQHAGPVGMQRAVLALDLLRRVGQVVSAGEKDNRLRRVRAQDLLDRALRRLRRPRGRIVAIRRTIGDRGRGSRGCEDESG